MYFSDRLSKELLVGITIASISLRCASGASTEQASTSTIRYDTINFGSYYKIPQDSVFFLALRDEKEKEISFFQNDSIYKVELFFKGTREIPIRIVSLNSLIHIEKIADTKNRYVFKVSKITPDMGKRYAKLAIVPLDPSTRYIFRNRFWLDSTHTTYQDASIQMDTLCKLTFKIN